MKSTKLSYQIITAFAPYLTPGQPMAVLPQQALFVACQLACMGLGIYKCWSMGLLPTESSDWLAWREPRVVSGRVKVTSLESGSHLLIAFRFASNSSRLNFRQFIPRRIRVVCNLCPPA